MAEKKKKPKPALKKRQSREEFKLEKIEQKLVTEISRKLADFQKKIETQKNYIKGYDFLNTSASLFLSGSDYPQIFKLIARRLKIILEDSVILINEYNISKKELITREIVGEKNDLKKIKDIFRKSIIGKTIKVKKNKNYQTSLITLKNREYIFIENQEEDLLKKLKQNLSIKKAYEIPLIYKRDCLASILIFSKKDLEPLEISLIESFAKLSSLGLNRSYKEKMVKENEEMFEKALSGSKTFVFSQDKRLNYTWGYNIPPHRGIRGLIGKSDRYIENDEEKQKILTLKNEVLKGEIIEDVIEVAHGSKQAFFKISLKPARRGKEITGLVGASTEVTDLKKAENKIKEQDEKLLDVLDFSNIAVWEMEVKKGKILQALNFERFFGRKKISNIKNIFRLIDPDDMEIYKQKLQKCMHEGSPYYSWFKLKNNRKNNTWIEDRGRLVDDNGVLKIRGVMVDITEIKKIEKALRASEEKHRLLVDSVKDGIVSVNSKSKIISWNKGAGRLFGYKEEEIIGKTIDQLFLKKYQKQQQEILNAEKGSVVGKTVELLGLKKDGSEFPAELSTYKWKLAGEVYFTGIIRDITDRKKADERKDEFVALVSHELKTPITTIKAYTQILERRLKEDKKNLYFLSSVDTQIDKITLLINDLLDTTKIQAGKLSLNKRTFSLQEIISKIVVDFQFATETHQIIVKGEIISNVYADQDRIGQVFINLLTNAIKYSPKADKIIVRLGEERGWATVAVQDFGIGMPKGRLKRIFDPFYIGKEKMPASIRSGLGLYISKQIIDRHDGKIWVESEKGKGSTFYFSLRSKK